jgi:plasmid stabilization system protein ParE
VARFEIQILAEAEDEMLAAFHGYFERSPAAADAFRAEALDAIDELAGNAERWPRDDSGLYRRVLRRFAYTIHYDLDHQRVTVLAIAHQRREPAYWVGRKRSPSP